MEVISLIFNEGYAATAGNRLGRHREARHELLRSPDLTGNDRERDTMLSRAGACARHGGSSAGGDDLAETL